jgi:hypothetical protein
MAVRALQSVKPHGWRSLGQYLSIQSGGKKTFNRIRMRVNLLRLFWEIAEKSTAGKNRNSSLVDKRKKTAPSNRK